MKALSIALNLTGEQGIGVPTIPAGTVLASGYYTDPGTGNKYYYNARTEQWYYVLGVNLIPLAISWQPSPSAIVNLAAGDRLRFNLSFYYVGPAVTKTFYAALGTNKTLGAFDEWSDCIARANIDIPSCAAKTLITGKYIDIVIGTAHNGLRAAAYCKLDQLIVVEGVSTTPQYYDVCYIVATAGEITDFTIASFVKA